jgi:hypothetical protein
MATRPKSFHYVPVSDPQTGNRWRVTGYRRPTADRATLSRVYGEVTDRASLERAVEQAWRDGLL